MSMEAGDSPASSSDDAGPHIRLTAMSQMPNDQLGAFQSFAVSNHKMVIATEHGYVVRIDLRSNTQDAVLIAQKCGPIRTIALDPVRGVHTIIGFASGDNFYLSAQSDKAVQLRKLDHIVITALAWDRENKNMASTGELLIGSETGAIYQAQLENHGKTVNFRKIYDIGQLEHELLEHEQPQLAIHGLHFERLLHDRKYMVMAATLTRHYQFVGG